MNILDAINAKMALNNWLLLLKLLTEYIATSEVNKEVVKYSKSLPKIIEISKMVDTMLINAIWKSNNIVKTIAAIIIGIKYSEKLNLCVKTNAAAISKIIIKLINENNL